MNSKHKASYDCSFCSYCPLLSYIFGDKIDESNNKQCSQNLMDVFIFSELISRYNGNVAIKQCNL